ncbi:MAG: beta-ketoacyl reductase, partial [Planctomycetota bacterium]
DAAPRRRRPAVEAGVGRIDGPLIGCIHAAGVLDDDLVVALDERRLEAVLAPKWLGATHLDACLPNELEHFVVYGSLAGAVGSPGQTIYSAANAAAAAVVEARRARGLPGLVVDWGPWSGGGMARDVLQGPLANGVEPIDPQLGLDWLGELLDAPAAPGRVGLGEVDWERFAARADGVLGALFSASAEALDSRPDPAVRLAELQTLSGAELEAGLEQLLAEQLAWTLGLGADRKVETDVPLAALGVDSLLAVELRHALERGLDLELPGTLLLDAPDLRSIAHAVAGLLERRRAAELDDAAALEAEIASLSDEEVQRLLAAERGSE